MVSDGNKSPRVGQVSRRTAETDIQLQLVLDGDGHADVETGIGFFDHMLTAFARHGLFDLTVRVDGDLHVDGHHTVEDTGLCLGQALYAALGDKSGIRRFGSAYVPMDDALVLAAAGLERPSVHCVRFDAAGAHRPVRCRAGRGIFPGVCHHGRCDAPHAPAGRGQRASHRRSRPSRRRPAPCETQWRTIRG